MYVSTIVESLERIVKCQKAYYQNQACLPLGLTNEQKRILMDGFPFEITKELSDAFDYQVESINFEPHITTFLSLEQSIEQSLFSFNNEIPNQVFNALGISNLRYFRGCFKSIVYQKAINTYPYDSFLMPIATGSCRDIYYTKCGKKIVEKSPIWVSFPGENPLEYAGSLTSLMVTIAECYEEGAYYPKFNLYDEEFRTGEWVIEDNLEKVESIFEKYNPDQIDNWRKIWKGDREL
jgi:hypothetical protein